MTDYHTLCSQLENLVSGIPHLTANLANAAALLWQTLENINWAGFYLVQDEGLVLGPFQGKPACIEIPIGRGVCGTAAAQKRTERVADVHAFAGHIACDAASCSEIVVPIFRGGAVAAVLDIDSPIPDRFSLRDQVGLERFAAILETALSDLW